jgi:hypothetical protein
MDMKPIFKKFLQDYGFIPFTTKNKNWEQFKIEHISSPPKKKEIRKIHKDIKDAMDGKAGIYIYLNEKEEVVYVGKSVNLASRIYSHYKDAFYGVGVWNHFFNQQVGKLTVLWREILHDRQRRALEEMIEDFQPSIFDKQFPRGKRHLTKKLC